MPWCVCGGGGDQFSKNKKSLGTLLARPFVVKIASKTPVSLAFQHLLGPGCD